MAKAISKESITPCYKGPRNGFPLQKVEGSNWHLCTSEGVNWFIIFELACIGYPVHILCFKSWMLFCTLH